MWYQNDNWYSAARAKDGEKSMSHTFMVICLPRFQRGGTGSINKQTNQADGRVTRMGHAYLLHRAGCGLVLMIGQY